MIHRLAVARRLCSVAFTVCAGGLASAPVTVIRPPAFTLDGALIDSVVVWHRDAVAPDFGAVTPANAITATATATIPIVSVASGLLMVLLRRPADPPAALGDRGAAREAAAPPPIGGVRAV